jgi:hypothetical protein
VPLNLKDLKLSVESGLGNERARLDCALFNREFYEGNFARFPNRTSGEQWGQGDSRYRRTVPVMQRIVGILTEHLYKEAPTRAIEGDEEATALLTRIYEANFVDAMWQEADALSVVSQVAAFQAVGGSDPDSPVDLHLWSADQLIVWEDDERPTRAQAVATIDAFDERRRLRLWTKETVTEFVTEKLRPDQTSGGTAYTQVSQEANEYGVIPFAFVHFKFPTRHFWMGSPGELLRGVNDYLNGRLTEMGDNMRFYARPISCAENVRPGWSPKAPYQPGQFLEIPSAPAAIGTMPAPARLYHVQADLSANAVEWADINQYLDLILEMEGVPPGTVRLQLTSDAQSGVSIVVQQGPLIAWARRRQKPFFRYESDLKTIVGKVAAAHLRNNSIDPELSTAVTVPRMGLASVADRIASGKLDLSWPDPYVEQPGPERDRTDDWRLQRGLVSKLELLMERENLSRDKALARLQQIAADQAELTSLGIDAGLPTPTPEPTQAPPAGE